MAEPSTRCPECNKEFTLEEAASAFFDGTESRWQCPRCGAWSTAPPPG